MTSRYIVPLVVVLSTNRRNALYRMINNHLSCSPIAISRSFASMPAASEVYDLESTALDVTPVEILYVYSLDEIPILLSPPSM
jgi:hypothetical protein